MVWYSSAASVMGFDAIRLDQETSLYFEINDTEAYRIHFLAVAQGLPSDLAHEAFLTELFRSNGETFGTVVLGGPPNEITSYFPRSKLVEPFLLAAERAIGNGCHDFWNEVIEISSGPSRAAGLHLGELDAPNVSTQRGRREAIEAYLATLLP
jgi:hypothetical protein